MLGATLMPTPPSGGGSWTLAILGLTALAAGTWAWIATMRRAESRDRVTRPLPEPSHKVAA